MDYLDRNTAETWAIDEDGTEIPGTGMRVVNAPQCPSHDMFGGRCIGVNGHGGSHWSYDSFGRYCQWWDGPLNPHDVASSQTPDDHDSYVRPKDRYPDTYVARTQWVPIEDVP